jgi:hypothetical protein
LAVHAGGDRTTVDPYVEEALDDQIREVALAEPRGVEPPEFADAHTARIVHGEPRTVVEHAESGCHTDPYVPDPFGSDGARKPRRRRRHAIPA